MREDKIIDAVFEVVHQGGDTRPKSTEGVWNSDLSFLQDDVPNLLKISTAFAVTIGLLLALDRTPSRLEAQDRAAYLATAAARERMTPAAYEAKLRAEFAQ